MKQCAVPMRERRDFGHRLDYTRFVIGEHNRHQCRPTIFIEETLKHIEPDDAVSVDRDVFGRRSSVQHGTVLNLRDQHALPPGTENRQMVGLGAAADKDDGLGRRRDQCRNRDPGALHRRPRRTAPAMDR